MANHQYNQFINVDAYPNINYPSNYPLDMRDASVLPLRSQEQSIAIDDGRCLYQQHHSQIAPQQYSIQEEDGQRGYSNFAHQACQQQQHSNQQHQSQYIIENKVLESAKMLVVLQSGEQRLITFTIPKESCTVQELLDQVGVPFTSHTNIECITNPGASYDYLVTIGPCNETPIEIVSAAENTLQRLQQQQYNTTRKIIDARPQVKRKYPQLAESPPPKLVPGLLAVCPNCGHHSTDHHHCTRCLIVFEENVRVIASAASDQPSVKKPRTIPSIITTEKQKKEMKHQISFAEKKNTLAGRGRGTWTISGHSLPMQTGPNSSAKFSFNNQPLPADSQSTHINRFVGSQFGSTFQQPTTSVYGSDSMLPYHQVGFGLNNSSSMHPQSRQTYDSMAWHHHPKSLHQTITSSAADSYDFNTASSSAWMRNGQAYESLWIPEGTGLSREMNPRQMQRPCNYLENNWESTVDKEKENETPKELIQSVNVCEEKDFSCVVCQDERKNILILPCRHLCVCEECSREIKLCPLCRNPIEELMTVFT